MAPVSARKQKQAGARGRGALPSTKPSANLFDDDFRTSKEDKRTIKHASFVSKIEKSSQKTPKRRRARNKLAANLDALADALPEADTDQPQDQVNIIKQKTLKHKPGALKRRQKIEKVERDRFARNMAQMSAMDSTAVDNTSAATGATPEQYGTSSRWAALRSFISQTMDQQPIFKGNK